jgi:hypothetical protein
MEKCGRTAVAVTENWVRDSVSRSLILPVTSAYQAPIELACPDSPYAPTSLFSGASFLAVGFESDQVEAIRQVVAPRGGNVTDERQLSKASGSRSDFLYYIAPHGYNLSRVQSLASPPLVSPFWLERCIATEVCLSSRTLCLVAVRAHLL